MEEEFSKLIMHKDFKESIEEVKIGGINLGKLGSEFYSPESEFDLEFGQFELEGITELKTIELNPRNGLEINEGLSNVVAYDESIIKFSSLEGDGILTSHTIVKLAKRDYLPISYVTFHFYTRSEKIAHGNKTIRLNENLSDSINEDYAKERSQFLLENVPSGSVLFVDGPLLGKNLSANTVKMNNALLQRDIFSIFVVKNSSSNLVINNVSAIKKNYNSDLHWASSFLRSGQRTNFFFYKDKSNIDLAKQFCYIRPFNRSPQRVEIHPNTYKKFIEMVPSMLNLLYYYFLANGNGKSQQARPIVIAEKYARKTLGMFDLRVIMKYTGVTPTVNEERF